MNKNINRKATKGYYISLVNQEKLSKYGAKMEVPHCIPSASLYLDILLTTHFDSLDKKENKKNSVKVDLNKGDAIGTVPCSNGDYQVYQSDYNVWFKAYPDVNITYELDKIHAWLDSNPKKTTAGCKKFLNAWFNRAQNSYKNLKANKTDILQESSERNWHEESLGI